MEIQPPVRIYADFNGLVGGILHPERTAVVVDTFGSVRDLANAGVVLKEGLPLIVFDESDENEDLEGHGTAQYDPERGWWVVEFDELGIRYVPAGVRVSSNKFLCVHCRRVIPELSSYSGFRAGASCSSCGTSVLAPIAPPRLAT
ncbi:hypothetical protein D3C81_1056940 [compost metagenome]